MKGILLPDWKFLISEEAELTKNSEIIIFGLKSLFTTFMLFLAEIYEIRRMLTIIQCEVWNYSD